MKVKRIIISSLITAVLLILTTGLAVGQTPRSTILGTGFTYQGQLRVSSVPYSGTCDFQFGLYDALSSGLQIGSTLTKLGVTVSSGLFTVQLDFGTDTFQGDARWLAIGVRCPAGGGSYTLLTPRQILTPVPYALALPGLRTQQNAFIPNVIGGYVGNWVAADVYGATIGGGGESDNANVVRENFGTVSGGANNQAGDDDLFTDFGFATIGGGANNLATGMSSTVSGGYNNTASNNYDTVGGGYYNSAVGFCSTSSGGFGNNANSPFSFVGGGMGNNADAERSTIAGGSYNNTLGLDSTICGGTENDAYGTYSFIGGGFENSSPGYGSSVGGGYQNSAFSLESTVAGGYSNGAIGDYSTVGGGYDNNATGSGSTVGGGYENSTSGLRSTVAGGYSNIASGDYSTVGGGYDNEASGIRSTVPGGVYNVASGYSSFAAGTRAKASLQGCFVWGDSTNSDVTCGATDQFTSRASGGFVFYTNSAMTSGAYISSGGGSWSSLSDRNMKENLESVDTKALLETLAEVPITTWNYISQEDSIRHIGPMAQDFYAAFGVGEYETHITTIDADGVALAAIQGLYAENQELKAQVNDLETRLTALEQAATVSGPRSDRLSMTFPWLLGIGLCFVGGTWVVRRRKEGGQ